MIIADDFGFDPENDRIIIDLISRGKIDGTSVLTSDRISDEHRRELVQLRQTHGAEIGLHLTLNWEHDSNSNSNSNETGVLGVWFSLLVGKIKTEQIFCSFHSQITHFFNVFGFFPDFLDGHQHCHAIPQAWPGLLRALRMLADCKSNFWVRSPSTNNIGNALIEFRRGGLKTLLVMCWGATLRTRLNHVKIKTNSDFSGFVHFGSADSFSKSFKQLLKKSREGCLIMVHPGSSYATRKTKGHSNELRAIETKFLMQLKRNQRKKFHVCRKAQS